MQKKAKGTDPRLHTCNGMMGTARTSSKRQCWPPQTEDPRLKEITVCTLLVRKTHTQHHQKSYLSHYTYPRKYTHVHNFYLVAYSVCIHIHTITVVVGKSNQLVTQVWLANIFRAPEVLYGWLGLLGR